MTVDPAFTALLALRRKLSDRLDALAADTAWPGERDDSSNTDEHGSNG